ncbi:MAG: hypothetical protein R2786_03420 [Flavobacteriaceae bacterium]
MIELDFFQPSDKYGVIKATVHKTGKLGFSSGADKLMELNSRTFFLVGNNKNDSQDDSLYLVPTEDDSDNSFKLSKAGDYYYINIKSVLRQLKINYKHESIIYDIEEIENENDDNVYYKLLRRDRK